MEVDRDRIALGVQQPWAELILRGVKRLEIRSRPTQQRGTVYVYASKRWSALPFADAAAHRWSVDCRSVPYGVLVGTVEIRGCRSCRPSDERDSCVPAARLADQFAWVLENPQRLPKPVAVRFLPYGVWFYPFRRRSDAMPRSATCNSCSWHGHPGHGRFDARSQTECPRHTHGRGARATH